MMVKENLASKKMKPLCDMEERQGVEMSKFIYVSCFNHISW